MTTPPTSEGSRGKRVMGWAAKDRGAEKGQTSTGRKTQGLSYRLAMISLSSAIARHYSATIC